MTGNSRKGVTVPLHAIAHGRAGDKGNTSNISVICHDPVHWPVLQKQVTGERILEAMRHLGATAVQAYPLPNLSAINFVIENALQGGVNASLGIDRHGKTLSFLILGDVEVTVPADTLPPDSPYLKGPAAAP